MSLNNLNIKTEEEFESNLNRTFSAPDLSNFNCVLEIQTETGTESDNQSESQRDIQCVNNQSDIDLNRSFKMSRMEFTVEKLSGSENYHDWCFAIENYVTFKGLKNCIVEKPKNADTDPSVAVEDSADKLDQSKSVLALSVEKSLYVHIRECKTALEIWNKFKHLYEDRGLHRKIGLLRSLISFRLEESDSMQAYIDGIMTTASKLTCIGFKLADEWLSAIMLAGLPE